MSADSSGLVVIGKITSVYGIKGWVKIHSFTENMEDFFSYTNCQIQRGGQWQPISFDEGKRHGKGLIANNKMPALVPAKSKFCTQPQHPKPGHGLERRGILREEA